MIRMATIANRLRDEVPVLKQAGTAAAFIKAQQGIKAMPAAFVLPARETAERNPFANQTVEQEIIADFAVMLAARDLSDATGGASTDSLEPLREQVRDALLNWMPEGADAGCEFVSGEMFQMDANGVLWWADTYRSGFPIRSVT